MSDRESVPGRPDRVDPDEGLGDGPVALGEGVEPDDIDL